MSKIILGTANFTNAYGVLSNGFSLSTQDIAHIIDFANNHRIRTLDTALAYGNIFSVASKEVLKNYKIITKISILEKPSEVIPRLNEQNKNHSYDSVLIHDPENIAKVSKCHIQELIESLQSELGNPRIGVSVYDEDQVVDFCQHYVPDIIQIPFNPFNQAMNSETFRTLVEHNNIEVHGRSLFLQGILLAPTLPKQLATLKDHFDAYQKKIPDETTPLHALLQWALFEMSWVDSWVVGVASLENLKEIIETVEKINTQKESYKSLRFQPVDHPLIDPRNWNFAA